ncbi:hypothetical protein [Agaribacterium sp. ZY112]|uniref:hypothetical protein n=1 Tax=Agaribacterium sp. ZY112 TaxID=3233574 RepID=UPI0035262B74
MDRANCLKEIIEYGARAEEAKSQIKSFGFDSESELYRLTGEVLANILDLYLSGTISSEELESWANFVECRDDIDHSSVTDHIYQLANPLITREITLTNIKLMASNLAHS